MPQERRVADYEFRGGPFGFCGIVGVGEVEYGVGLPNGVQRAEYRIMPVCKSVELVPLDIAYLERGSRYLRRVRVYLQSVHLARTHGWRQIA